MAGLNHQGDEDAFWSEMNNHTEAERRQYEEQLRQRQAGGIGRGFQELLNRAKAAPPPISINRAAGAGTAAAGGGGLRSSLLELKSKASPSSNQFNYQRMDDDHEAEEDKVSGPPQPTE